MVKLPILNNHKCEGIYGLKWGFCPRHYCWIPHIILGILSIKIPLILPVFITYQLSQIITKREVWDDFIDIVEFYIGRIYFSILIKKVLKLKF